MALYDDLLTAMSPPFSATVEDAAQRWADALQPYFDDATNWLESGNDIYYDVGNVGVGGVPTTDFEVFGQSKMTFAGLALNIAGQTQITYTSGGVALIVEGQASVKDDTYPPFAVTRTTASTNTRQASFRLAAESSQTFISDGFGTQIDLGFGDNDASSILGRWGIERSGADNSSLMFFQTASGGTLADRITIDPTGNVEVLTGSLDVGSNDILFNDPQNSNTDVKLTGNDTAFPDTGIALRCLTNPSSGSPIFRVLSSGGAERLRVEHDGVTYVGQQFHVTSEVGIGTAPTTTFALEVLDNVAGWMVRFWNDGNNANRDGMIILAGSDAGTGVTDYYRGADGNGNSVGYIENNNGVYQLVDVSDENAKSDIEDSAEDALSKIKQLRHIQFRFSRHGPQGKVHKHGFSAQDMQAIIPDAVSVDRYENGRLGIARTHLIPYLTRAIQQQQDLIEALQAQVDALQTQVEGLTP